MIKLNEDLTKRNDNGSILVVLESSDMAELLESNATSFAIKHAQQMGLAPAGITNMPRPVAVDAETDMPIMGPCPKIKGYRMEVVCGSAIP